MAFGITSKRELIFGGAATLGALLVAGLIPSGALAKSAKFSILLDLAYGKDPLQTLDVYALKGAKDAPVILMAHGGGWMVGDKANAAVFANKADHFLAKGYLFVSVNYRMVPAADPVEQARDVARSLAYVQANASLWGGDPKRVVLMGHSAGAHLISLINADPAFARDAGAEAWLAAISLDSGAYDIEAIMKRPHLAFYDQAFGKDKAFWRAASPIWRIKGKPAPMLLVCSSRLKQSCTQAAVFKAALDKEKAVAEVALVDLSHREINANLGLKSAYTKRVDAFLRAQGLP